MNADAVAATAQSGKLQIILQRNALDFERATHRLHRAGEKHEQAIAGRFEHLAAKCLASRFHLGRSRATSRMARSSSWLINLLKLTVSVNTIAARVR